MTRPRRLEIKIKAVRAIDRAQEVCPRGVIKIAHGRRPPRAGIQNQGLCKSGPRAGTVGQNVRTGVRGPALAGFCGLLRFCRQEMPFEQYQAPERRVTNTLLRRGQL